MGFLLVPWLGWTEICVRLPSCSGGCPSFLPSLPTCVMYSIQSIGFLSLSGYSIVSLQWSPVVSLAAPPLTSTTSAAHCPVSVLAARRVLRPAARGEFFCPSGPFGYYAAKGLFGCGSISMG